MIFYYIIAKVELFRNLLVFRGDEQGFFTLKKKAELVFQHNRKQIHREVLLWIVVKRFLQLESEKLVALENLENILQIKYEQCDADVASNITRQKTRNINCS